MGYHIVDRCHYMVVFQATYDTKISLLFDSSQKLFLREKKWFRFLENHIFLKHRTYADHKLSIFVKKLKTYFSFQHAFRMQQNASQQAQTGPQQMPQQMQGNKFPPPQQQLLKPQGNSQRMNIFFASLQIRNKQYKALRCDSYAAR